MNHEKALRWISLDMDGELSVRRKAILATYLEAHPELRAASGAWASQQAMLRARASAGAVSAERAWQDVRRALRQLDAAGARVPARAPVLALRYAMAVTLLAVVAGGALFLASRRPAPAPRAIAGAATGVELVETDLSHAALIVYKDDATDAVVVWVSSENGIAPRNDQT